MRNDLVELKVHGVAMDPGEGMPVVILLEPTERAGLTVPLGPFEASAIILELEGVAPPRPHTHDLLAGFFREGGFHLEAAEIYGGTVSGSEVAAGEALGAAREARASAPLARLVYRRGLRRGVREVRPSDAIALALRLRAPIRSDRSLLRRRGAAGSLDFPSSPSTLFLKAEEGPPRRRPNPDL